MLSSVFRVLAVDFITFCAALLHDTALFTVAVVVLPAALINEPATRAAEPVEATTALAPPGVDRPTAAARCIASAALRAPQAAEKACERGAAMATIATRPAATAGCSSRMRSKHVGHTMPLPSCISLLPSRSRNENRNLIHRNAGAVTRCSSALLLYLRTFKILRFRQLQLHVLAVWQQNIAGRSGHRDSQLPARPKHAACRI